MSTDTTITLEQISARLERTERRLHATWGVALASAVSMFALGYHKDAIAQGYTITLAQAATRIAALETKTASMSTLNDPDGNATIRFTNVNVQIVSGAGATDGTVNGRGNLIMGYNERLGMNGSIHTGSHNIIGGLYQNYSSYSGIIMGVYSTVSGPYSAVLAGQGNTVNGNFSSVVGGANNTANGSYSSISGGQGNTTTGQSSVVSAGSANNAIGAASSISGGASRTVSSAAGWVAGNFGGTTYTGNFASQ